MNAYFKQYASLARAVILTVAWPVASTAVSGGFSLVNIL